MEWTCTSCGTAAYAERVELVVAMGWSVVDLDGSCVCRPCRLRDDPAMIAARAMRHGAVAMREDAREQLESAREQHERNAESMRRK
jgi:tagatose-1,6-bisphosphate aldolase non-catalytic subunit AgaZ/GatZ